METSVVGPKIPIVTRDIGVQVRHNEIISNLNLCYLYTK